LQILPAKDASSTVKFAIAGADGIFQYVNGNLENENTLTIQIPKGMNVKYVSYCWDDNPGAISLFNSAGLPVTPFKVVVE